MPKRVYFLLEAISMKTIEILRQTLGDAVSLEPVRPQVNRLYAPFFHEDGDMLSIYLDECDGKLTLRDFGNTIMRVSYTFNMNSENKQSIFSEIVRKNYGELDNGELIIRSSPDRLINDVFQFTQIIAKVSSIDIIGRETVRSMFYDNLHDFIINSLKEYAIKRSTRPTKDEQLVVDYEIPGTRPIFLFGVNDNTKASRTTICCLNYQKRNMQFSSLIVYENMEDLTRFNRVQLTNASDKQYAYLDDFINEGSRYIARTLAS